MINLSEHLESIERHYIKQALIVACGNQSIAADELCLNRTTFIARMKAHRITWQGLLAEKLIEDEPQALRDKITDIDAAKVELRRNIIKQVMRFCEVCGDLAKEKLGDSIFKS